MAEVVHVGGDTDLRLVRADGKIHVSWVEQDIRQLFTVDEETAEVVDQRGWTVVPSDARILQGMLRCLDSDAGKLGRRVWERYRNAGRGVLVHTNGVPAEIAALFELPMSAFSPSPRERGFDLDVNPTFTDDEAEEFFFGRSSGHYYDRRLRAINLFEYAKLMDQPGYGHVARTRIADRLPPFLSFDVSTTWIGTNTMPSGFAPQVFETLIMANTRASLEHVLDGAMWRHRNEPEAAASHRILVEATIEQHTTDARVLPVRRRGRRRDAKPYKGMNARLRRLARDFRAASGSLRVRGRHGQPDRWVHWTWHAEQSAYHVQVQPDPVLTPVPAAAACDRRRRARARRRRRGH